MQPMNRMTGDNRSVFRAAFTLFGTIVGAGILGLPYIVAKSGYAVGLFWMVVLTAAVTLTHVLFGEVVMATPGRHRAVGYARMYLGRGASWVETAASILGLYGATLAYMILGSLFLRQLASPIIDIHPLAGPVILFATGMMFAGKGVNYLAKAEVPLAVVLALAFLALIVKGFTDFDAARFPPVDLANAFLPYGVVLFAYGGLSAVPEMFDLVGNRPRTMRRGIVAGTVMAAVITILFVTAVLGALGPETTPEAIAGINRKFGGVIPQVSAVAGLLAVVTSYYIFSLYLKNQFQFDFKIKRPWAAVLAVGAPFVLYLAGVRSFGRVLELVGATLIGIEGMLVCLMYLKVRKAHPEKVLPVPAPVVYLLTGIYAAGALYEIVFRVFRGH